MKENKFLYGWNLWTNYGYGWEIECFYDKRESTFAEVFSDAKQYKIAGASTKICRTRVKNPNYNG